ncbi:MAG: hypothetical protein Q9M13_02810 [Mariprofundales bacterium]|nr:hypothetical protein [Mariprofundales bacterium]
MVNSGVRRAALLMMCWRTLISLGMLTISAEQGLALDLRTDLVWWQYEEQTADRRYAGAPFHSKADTITLAIKTTQSYEINSEWQWRYSLSSLIPTAQANERWLRVDYLQTNDLRIGQLDAQLELLRTVAAVNVGLWSALRWQQQARQHFRQNGAPLADPLVTETIRTAWAGGVVTNSWLRVEAGVPLWVYTTNSSISATFSKRQGYRIGGELRTSMAQLGYGDFELHGAYHYQQLGGDPKPQALWPSNRLQTISLGASARW